MRQIVLDTETTGLSAADGDRIIEVGCVELFNRKLTGRNLHFYVNPERDSHPDALKVHGLTTEFLSDKPLFAHIADELLEYVRDAELIIHNAPFDVGFLDAELKRLKKPSLRDHVGNIVDTLVMAKDQFPGKRNSLDALCDRLSVDNSGRTLHGALLDAELLADVYIALTRGQDSLSIDALMVQEGEGVALGVANSALAELTLPVIAATDSELAAHEELLADMAKATKSPIVWRAIIPA